MSGASSTILRGRGIAASIVEDEKEEQAEQGLRGETRNRPGEATLLSPPSAQFSMPSAI
jgi:hypothetical protein